MSEKYTILVVEDESAIGNFITTILTANQYAVLRAVNATEAMMMASSYCPDLILLDLGLPDCDGTKIITSIREWSRMPIVVVSARTHERDKIEALDLGADDYITKPFGTGELLARIRTALRHHSAGDPGSATAQSGVFKAKDLTIDYDKRHVYVGETDIHLTQNEYKIVSLLSQYSGRVLTYDWILKSVWGPNISGDNQILRVNMANIRRKLEKNPADPHYIFTEMGVGYRMIERDVL